MKVKVADLVNARSLTEPIVQHTLEPLVYVGPREGKPREGWRLRSTVIRSADSRS